MCIRTIFTLLQFEEIHLQLKQFEKSNIRKENSIRMITSNFINTDFRQV